MFLKPLEALLGVSRADLALVFALASAGFGSGMNLAPYVYGLASAPVDYRPELWEDERQQELFEMV